MFNNRQSRRRFRLGNLARLVQLRQSVSSQPPRRTVQETLSQSPPQSPLFHPQSPPEPKSLPLSPLSPKSKEEPESQTMTPLMSKHVKTHRNLLIQSPPKSPPESTESQQQFLASVPLRPLTTEPKTPLSPSSTLKATEESQSQPSPPLESIVETWFRPSPPTSTETGDETQLPIPPPQEAKTPPSSPSMMLNATEEFESQPKPPLLPSKSIDETRLRSPLMSQASSPPPLPSKSIDENETRSQSPPISPPKSDKQARSQTHSSPSPPPLLSPKASENHQSKSPMPPPSPTAQISLSSLKSPIPSPATITAPAPPFSSPLSQTTPSPKPSLPQIEPNQIKSPSPKLTNTESHASPEQNLVKPDANLMNKIPAKNEVPKNRGTLEKKTEPMIMMFINSNVQGFNTSLSLDSSSIDHKPGVHLTIDYDQSCDFS
ncbi:unnamed protein product [Arabidopsis thaliana]|uniref:Uncharacterized protein n=1 Tax=Arabidopsis thaliana TaxID=3702 RepID=A0A654FKP3_ARATH|nr:unnamed protein product [Arabidopsis thaliana]